MKTIIVLLVLSVTLTGALAFNYGGDGTSFGHMGASTKAGTQPIACGAGAIDLSQGCTIPIALGLVP